MLEQSYDESLLTSAHKFWVTYLVKKVNNLAAIKECDKLPADLIAAVAFIYFSIIIGVVQRATINDVRRRR